MVEKLRQNSEQVLQKVLKLETPQQIEAQEKPKDLKTEPSSGQLVRFTQEVPKFMGTDLQVYGPYQPEDLAKLPAEIADLLVRKEKAEAIQEK